MATLKRSTTYRLSPEARVLVARLAELHGIGKTAIVEMAIRLLARRDLGERRKKK